MPFKSHFLGFTSLSDFITSQFGTTSGLIHTTTVTFAAITTFITGFVWEDPNVIYTLWILMVVDYASGITKAIVGKRFVSFRLWRMPIYFFVTTTILSLGFWMAKATVIFALLPSILIAGFMSIYFISILENLGELKLLPKPLIGLLKNKFGMQALIDHFDKTSEPIADKLESEEPENEV